MKLKAKKRYIYLLLSAIVLGYYCGVWHYLGVMIGVITVPDKMIVQFEYGRYGGWGWTPDGRIIYTKQIEQMEHTKGMGTMGYRNLGSVTQIRVINKDGSEDKLIKETFYQSSRQKLMRRYNEYRKKNDGYLPYELSNKANAESSDGTLNKIYPDAPLSHIGWIDWNAKNNKLVFVANDGTGKKGIAISDPEFKEVKWINYDGFWPKWSPDGTKVAFIKMTWKDGQPYEYGDIWLMDIEGENLKQITNGYTFDTLYWFPNGKQLIADHFPPYYKKDAYSGMGIVDIFTGKMKELGSGLRPNISPDGQWVIHNQGIMNLETGEKRKFGYSLKFPKWSPNGKFIIDGWEGGVRLYDFEHKLVQNKRKVTQDQELDPKVVADFDKGQ